MAQVMSKTKTAPTKPQPHDAADPEGHKGSVKKPKKAASKTSRSKSSPKAQGATESSSGTSAKGRSAASSRAASTGAKKKASTAAPKAASARKASASSKGGQASNGDNLSKAHARLSRKILDEREKLVRQAEELEAEQQALAADPDAAEMSGDAESGDCVASREREVDLKLSAHIQEMIAQIDRATERLDAGTYGACARCHARIPAARLEALPYAELCVSCQEKHERLYY